MGLCVTICAYKYGYSLLKVSHPGIGPIRLSRERSTEGAVISADLLIAVHFHEGVERRDFPPLLAAFGIVSVLKTDTALAKLQVFRSQAAGAIPSQLVLDKLPEAKFVVPDRWARQRQMDAHRKDPGHLGGILGCPLVKVDGPEICSHAMLSTKEMIVPFKLKPS